MYIGDGKLGSALVTDKRNGLHLFAVRPMSGGYGEYHPQDSQERINKCLSCPYAVCTNCLSGRKTTSSTKRVGRPSSVDLDKLREMLVLKTPKREIMQTFGICESTYYRVTAMVKVPKAASV